MKIHNPETSCKRIKSFSERRYQYYTSAITRRPCVWDKFLQWNLCRCDCGRRDRRHPAASSADTVPIRCYRKRRKYPRQPKRKKSAKSLFVFLEINNWVSVKWTYVRNAKEIEFEHADDGLAKLVPVGAVVAEPVARSSPAAHESRPAEHKTTFSRQRFHSSAKRALFRIVLHCWNDRLNIQWIDLFIQWKIGNHGVFCYRIFKDILKKNYKIRKSQYLRN